MKTGPSDINVDVRYQTILIIWMAPVPLDPEKASLAIVLSAVSVVPVAISFFVKTRMLARAAETQNLALVQQAYVTGFALCEVAVLLGVLIHFLAGSQYRFIAIVIGAAGILLHFPRKKHLLDATFKPL